MCGARGVIKSCGIGTIIRFDMNRREAMQWGAIGALGAGLSIVEYRRQEVEKRCEELLGIEMQLLRLINIEREEHDREIINTGIAK